MRTRLASIHAVTAVLVLGLVACGEDSNLPDDAGIDAPRIDAAVTDATETDAPVIDAPSIDAPTDAAVDAGIDTTPDATPTPTESIAAVKAAADGAQNLAIIAVTVTYIKPQIGSITNDPAGFTVQAEQNGPAVFVAVDPSTLTPVPVVGDVVNFTVTMMGTTAGARRVTAISNFSRMSQGANVGALAQNLSAATNVASAIDMYEAEIADVSGTIATNFAAAGQGFESAQITTAGVTVADPAFLIRVPATFRSANDLVMGCTFTLDNTPVGKFVQITPPLTMAQLSAFVTADIAVANCPAPVVVAAVATSATSVQITFSRNLAPASVMANGSQFTFDNGLTANAASVSGRAVTVTTSVQNNGDMHIATVANTVTDTFGTALGTPSTAMFTAFASPTHLVINEVDYDMPVNPDALEFVEIYNPTPNPMPLANLALAFSNGSNNAEYRARVDLSSAGATLASGAYLVVRATTVTVPIGTLTIDLSGTDIIQNGAPDGLAILNTSTLTIVDRLSYEGSLTAAIFTGFTGTFTLVEGTAATAVDTGTTDSIGRFPNGIDSDNAAADWAVRTTSSPGATN